MLEPYKENIIAIRLGNSTKTQGGAIQTASTAEKSLKVKITKSGHPDFKPDDIVVIKKYTGDDYDDEGTTVLFITEDDILAKESK